MTAADVAARLGITDRTVRRHLASPPPPRRNRRRPDPQKPARGAATTADQRCRAPAPITTGGPPHHVIRTNRPRPRRPRRAAAGGNRRRRARGQGRPVPRPAVPASRRAAARGQPGELREIIPGTCAPGRASARRCAGTTAAPAITPCTTRSGRPAARPDRRVGARRRRPDRVRACSAGGGSASRRTSGTRPPRRTTPQLAEPAQARPRGPPRPRLRLLAEVLGLALAAGVVTVPPAGLAALRPWWRRCWRGSAGRGQADPDRAVVPGPSRG